MKPYKTLFGTVKEYVGIDVYPGDNVDIVYDGKSIPCEDGYFDVVFSSSVFEHVEDLNYSLSETHRILKESGVLISVVPFINHVHGTPYDFHRPTRFGWQKFLSDAGYTDIKIEATDNRFQCSLNLVTSVINNSVYSFARIIKCKLFRGDKMSISLNEGGASPESSKRLSTIYFIMKLNPINFLLGLLSLSIDFIDKPAYEGEITSGYLIIARK